MPVNFLVSDVISDATLRADFDTFGADTEPSSTEVLEMVKESALRLSGIVRTCFSDDYFTTESDVTTTSGVQYVALPTNLTSLKHVVWVRGTDDFIELERARPHQAYAWSQGWNRYTSPRYSLRSNGINFFPTPDATYTVRLIYDTGLIITATSDTISGEAGWREWLVCDLCIKLRQLEEKPYPEFAAQKSEVEQLFKRLEPRDKAAVRVMRDLDDDYNMRRRPWDYYR